MLACSVVYGQLTAQSVTSQPDSTALMGVKAYQEITGYASRLYNGSEYIRSYPNVVGHPFLSADSMMQGAIAYDGVWYTGISLNYDIVRDEVIVKGPQVFSLRLVPEKIDSFHLSDRRFHRFNSSNPYQLSQGFYEVLYKGRVWVLANRVKNITKPFTAAERLQFTDLTTYFVINGGVARKISDKNDLVNAFGDRKEAIKKHMQQANLNFKKDPEQTIAAVAAFYDQIKN